MDKSVFPGEIPKSDKDLVARLFHFSQIIVKNLVIKYF